MDGDRAARHDPASLARPLYISFGVAFGIVTLGLRESFLAALALTALTLVVFLGLVAVADGRRIV